MATPNPVNIPAWVESDPAASAAFESAARLVHEKIQARDALLLWGGVGVVVIAAAALGASADEFWGPLMGPLNFGSICYWALLATFCRCSFLAGRASACSRRAGALLGSLRCPLEPLDARVKRLAPAGATGDGARGALDELRRLRHAP
jgi:hypothetical protein